MIGRIAGTLIEKNPPHLLVDCHGIGYETGVPVSMSCNLPATSGKVILFMQQIVREDAHLLYSFGTAAERETFRQFIKIPSIGAHIVLAALSGISVTELTQAVTLQEAGWLTRIPDIGKETAEHLLLEFKDKFSANLGTVPGDPAISDDVVDALNALLAPGYSDKEAAFAIKQAPAGVDVSEGIRLVLKALPKGWHPGAARWWNGLLAPSQCRLPVMIEAGKLAIRAVSAERVISTFPASPNKGTLEHALHPKLLGEYVSWEKVRGQLNIFMTVAKNRNETLDHVLLLGPSGLDKTTLTYIIAHEMGVNLRQTSDPVLECPGDLAILLTNLEANNVLSIDGIHRLLLVVEETLYPALKNYQIDITIGRGPAARSAKLNLQPFTLVGTITRVDVLVNLLHDRFGIAMWLEFYTPTELIKIVMCSSGLLNAHIVGEGVLEIAKHLRGTPRIANYLLRRVHDSVEVKADGIVTHEAADAALAMLDVGAAGSDLMNRRLFEAILHKFDGSPVDIDNLAVATGEEHDTIEDVLEPYLIQQGYLQRTPRGRVATVLIYQHFGLDAPKSGPTRDLWGDNQ